MAHQVFISYANDKGTGNNRDFQVAEEICNALEAKNIRCWMAPRDIKGGDKWTDAILKAVKKSRLVVLVFSSNANQSQWVKDEITIALNKNIPIISFCIENVSPEGALEFIGLRFQRIDAFKAQPQDYIDELVKAVQEHLETEPVKTEKAIELNEQPQLLREKIQEPKDMPEDVKAVQSRCKKFYKNGFWEADYGDDIVMVYIPPGEFTMGSNDNDNEKPLHTVLLDGYWMGKYEVTFDQYDKYCGETKKGKPSDQGWGRGKRPIINVSWKDANAYCDWLSNKIGLKFKLPTEAQWEKAARGTDGREFPWGNQEPDDKLANFSSNIGKTTPVGSYPDGASPYGLLDMAGNVWEWCNDWYESDYYKESPYKNPTGPDSDSKRVQRSGSWNYDAGYLRCAFRGNGTPSLCFDFVGFRLCQDNK